MSDQEDLGEIISRPASHPIATTLLVVSMLGTLLAIGFVWAELFGSYLPAGVKVVSKSRKIAEKHVHNHYAADFGKDGDLMTQVEKDLGITPTIGGSGN